MELEFSPHRAGGSLHLLSPKHAHMHAGEFPTIRQLRRSLSRSPSKQSPVRPSNPRNTRSSSASPQSPLSPSNLSQVFFASTNTSQRPAGAPITAPSATPVSGTVKKTKFSLRRTAPARTSSASTRRQSPKSPIRRALSDNTNQANIHEAYTALTFGEENKCPQFDGNSSPDDRPMSGMKFQLDDEPIHFESLKTRSEGVSKLRHSPPARSSPLKRSDGVMNLEQATFGSPRAKRRSLHGATFGNDFDIFDYAESAGFTTNPEAGSNVQESTPDSVPSNLSTATPYASRASPRKPNSLRKSTLQQRYGGSINRSKLFQDAEPVESPNLFKSKNRMSLDSALSFKISDDDSPFRRPQVNEAASFLSPNRQQPLRGGHADTRPHPLSKALTPSSSMSSAPDESPTHIAQVPPEPTKPSVSFSKSLPIGAARPQGVSALFQRPPSGETSGESFATPDYKNAKPLPQAFMSTGLISKRNRNMDGPDGNFYANPAMPDTPSKKFSFPVLTATPAPANGLGKSNKPRHSFGTPSTPFSPHPTKVSPEAFGKGVSIFGSRARPALSRRASFLSNDGEDASQNTVAHLDGQSSNDELPPTPTKASGMGRPQSKGKSNSLRSSLLGRRTSLGADTFIAPEPTEVSTQLGLEGSSPPALTGRSSPHTPSQSFTPPDPSFLSISAEDRQNLLATSTGNRRVSSFPPATPTTTRDQPFSFSFGQSAVPLSYKNDVDTSITSRFGKFAVHGVGEFSEVYRVESPLDSATENLQNQARPVGHVWAIKKTKKPYIGQRDRERKLREVEILTALRGHEHIVDLFDSWESKNHLYIQTEFCENGNLRDFLNQAGFKGRLDDFRIWKILLELSQVSWASQRVSGFCTNVVYRD